MHVLPFITVRAGKISLHWMVGLEVRFQLLHEKKFLPAIFASVFWLFVIFHDMFPELSHFEKQLPTLIASNLGSLLMNTLMILQLVIAVSHIQADFALMFFVVLMNILNVRVKCWSCFKCFLAVWTLTNMSSLIGMCASQMIFENIQSMESLIALMTLINSVFDVAAHVHSKMSFRVYC